MKTEDLVLAYLAAFASGDAERIATCVSDDFENNQINELGSSCKGRAVYRDRLRNFLGRFNGLRYTSEELIVEDNRVAVAYRMNATENGVAFEIRGVMLITVSNGLIQRRDDYWDGLSYQRQTRRVLPEYISRVPQR